MTTYLIPEEILNTVTTALRINKGVKIPEPLPCDSVKWALENDRDLTGFTDMNALGIARDGSIFIKNETTLSEDEPEEYAVAVDIRDGQVNVSIDYHLVENFNIFYDTDKSETLKNLTEVAEITFTK